MPDSTPVAGEPYRSVEDDPALIAMVRSRPEDPGACMVYADWLQSMGDPRGEWIAVCCAITQATEHQELITLRQRRDDLYSRYADLLHGGTASDSRVSLEWENGLVRTVRLQNLLVARHGYELLRDVLDLPLAFALRRVSLDLPSDGSTGGAQVTRLLPPLPPSLRGLRLWAYGQHVGRLDELLTREMADVDIRGIRPELGPIEAPSLERLTLMAITPETLQSLVGSKLPALASLDVALEPLHPLYGTDLLANADLPALRDLRVFHGIFPAPLAELVDELARGKLLPQLRRLSFGIVTEPTAERIAVNARAFSHLERLELHGECTAELLARIGPHAELVRRMA